MKRHILFFILVFWVGNSFTQSEHKLLRQGNANYAAEEYNTAEENYRKALEKGGNTKSVFNLGNSVYQQQRFEEAIQHYETILNKENSSELKADAFFNLGNAQLQNGQINEAIQSYKEGITLNPKDPDLLKNLYLAKLMQQQQNRQQQEKDQEQKQEGENQDNQQQQKNQGQNDDNQSSSESEINNDSNKQDEGSESKEISKEDALKLLKVIENEEKNIQEKLRKVSGNRKKPKKDW